MIDVDVLWKLLTNPGFWNGVFQAAGVILPILQAAGLGLLGFLVKKWVDLSKKQKRTDNKLFEAETKLTTAEDKLTVTENKLTDKVWLKEAFEVEMQELIKDLGVLRLEVAFLRKENAELKIEIALLRGEIPTKEQPGTITEPKHKKRPEREDYK